MAGPVRAVEGEHAGFQFGVADAALDTGQLFAEYLFAGTFSSVIRRLVEQSQDTLAEAQSGLDGVVQPGMNPLLGNEPVDDDIDVVRLPFGEPYVLVDVIDDSIDPDANISFLAD